MKKFLFLVVAVGALYYFKPGLFPSFGKNGALDSKGNPQVLVFTSKQCNDPCTRAVQDLRERKVDFKEVVLDDNNENISRYEKLGGNGTIPLLAVGKLSVQGYDKGMFASVLAQTYGDKALTQLERIYYSRHFKADGTPAVYMYGATWCGFCTVMRNEMGKRKIDFAEVDVDTVADKAEIEYAMGLDYLPVTYVGYTRIVGAKSMDPVLDAVQDAVKTSAKRRM